jgi:hypothetical protein
MSESLPSFLEHYKRANKKIIGLRRDLDDFYYAEGLRDVCTAFEGFLKYKGHKGSNKDKIHKFSISFTNLFRNWGKTNLFNESIQILISKSPVQNMENNKLFSINNPNDLEDIINFCFVPRGNLNHAEKSLLRDDEIGKRNRDLVEHSFKVLHEILQKAMLEGGLIK